uniref:uncharacterized protein LOC131138314 n=1 Tax=Doryrhamphus excisus TaxID=161450 RepID=UPI0025AE05B7|nr:uncharacterized protein LOC131138314 [Doryrhamphus excisus]
MSSVSATPLHYVIVSGRTRRCENSGDDEDEPERVVILPSRGDLFGRALNDSKNGGVEHFATVRILKSSLRTVYARKFGKVTEVCSQGERSGWGTGSNVRGSDTEPPKKTKQHLAIHCPTETTSRKSGPHENTHWTATEQLLSPHLFAWNCPIFFWLYTADPDLHQNNRFRFAVDGFELNLELIPTLKCSKADETPVGRSVVCTLKRGDDSRRLTGLSPLSCCASTASAAATVDLKARASALAAMNKDRLIL